MLTHNSALQWLENSRKQAVYTQQNLTGQTACSQLIRLENGERYVLRKQTQRATNLGINYQLEAQLLRTLAPLNIAPLCLYSDPNTSLLQWIEGTPPAHFHPHLLNTLAKHLAKLHQFPLQGGRSNENFAYLNLAERCQFLWNKLPSEKRCTLPFRPPFTPIEPLSLALCHHDLHLSNLIEQGDKLFIIDWEYAAISDPALDLSLFLQSNPLSEKEQHYFLECYFAKNTLNPTRCRAKILEYQPLIEKLNALWYAF